MDRLFFRKSKNKGGQECYIAKVKEYEREADGKKTFKGDMIVIANTDRCAVSRQGRWDVEVKPMYGAKGYLVFGAEWTADVLDFVIDWDNYAVYLLVNGAETKLKRSDKGNTRAKYLPLSFRSDDYYPIDKIVGNIKDKAFYLQLPDGFQLPVFLAEYQKACEAVYGEYAKYQKTSSRRYSAPNTPLAEGLKKLAGKK